MSKETIGVIKEQGDLGLFFDPVSEKEQSVLEQTVYGKKEKDKEEDRKKR